MLASSAFILQQNPETAIKIRASLCCTRQFRNSWLEKARPCLGDPQPACPRQAGEGLESLSASRGKAAQGFSTWCRSQEMNSMARFPQPRISLKRATMQPLREPGEHCCLGPAALQAWCSPDPPDPPGPLECVQHRWIPRPGPSRGAPRGGRALGQQPRISLGNSPGTVRCKMHTLLPGRVSVPPLVLIVKLKQTGP